MSSIYPPRIQDFRDEIMKVLPRAPNNQSSLKSLRAMSTQQLIIAYVTWRMRLIPAKPRTVRLWSGGVQPVQFLLAKRSLRPLLDNVAAGADLTPHLSDLARRRGIILPGASPQHKRQDIDMVLTRHGLHHFHVGVAGAGNPTGRSAALVFAEVLEEEFRIVALSDHRAFEQGSVEQRRFFRICMSYMAKDVPPGQGFMPNPVMSSGHSMLVTLFARRCADEMTRLDPLLDEVPFLDQLYQGQPSSRDRQPVTRPTGRSLAWYFEDLQFGMLGRQSPVFFCLFPFFAR
jgi:hypothetical protein